MYLRPRKYTALAATSLTAVQENIKAALFENWKINTALKMKIPLCPNWFDYLIPGVSQTYWRAEVVSHFVGEGDMGDLWRHVRCVVLHCYNPGVQWLPLPIGIQLSLFTDTTRAPWESEIIRILVKRTCNATGGKKD